MSYLHWLLGISAGFVLLERWFPWRKGQSAVREGWLRDLGFLTLSGHFFSLLTAGITGAVAAAAARTLGYPGMQEMPLTFHGQVLWPGTRHPGTPVAGPEASLQ